MKTIKIIVSVLLCTCMSVASHAQKGTARLNADYSFGLPSGDLKDFVDNNSSARGWNLGVMFGLSDKLSLGGSVGYQNFYNKFPRQVYHTSEGDISGVLTNSVELLPLLVKAKYNFTPGAAIQPYVGVGTGAAAVLYRQNLGEYEWDSRNKVAFVASPEAGVNFRLSQIHDIGINLSAAYNIIPFNYGVVNNLNNIAVKAGISIPLRR